MNIPRNTRPRTLYLDRDVPPIVCLCGSTRFAQAFAEANEELTMNGAVVLAPGCFSRSTPEEAAQGIFAGATPEQKAELDAVHLRKIGMADGVVVLNVDGYVGDSTAREIAFAEGLGLPVLYLESVATREEGFLDEPGASPVEGSFPVLTPESRRRIQEARRPS